MNTGSTKLGASFHWLNVTQFLGALNDNIFRLLIVFFLIAPRPEMASSVMAVTGAVFVVPFLIFTAFAGKLADRLSKRNIVIAAKIAEAVLMVAGYIAFTIGSPIVLYIVLFLMCTQSAFFGPSKYGIVPELVRTDQLSKANSFIEAFTYIAIVIGTAAAPFIIGIIGKEYYMASIICVVIAAIGIPCSFLIGKTAPAGGDQKASLLFVRDIYRTLLSIRHDKNLLLAVIASAYFMLLGGFMQMNLIPYGIQHLGFDETQSGYLFLIASLGIGFGSFLAGKLSGRNVEFGIVPIGAVGLAVCSIALAFTTNKIPVYTVIFLTGTSAGLFIVPVHAFIQLSAPAKSRGQVIAASGFLGWIGVLLSAIILYVFGALLEMSAASMFLILGIFTLILASAAIIMLPDFLIRLIIVLLTRFCYRIKVIGSENIPVSRGILLVCNHVSWADAVILSATQQRRIRFIMDKDIYNNKWLKPICKLMKVIPISSQDPPKQIVASLREGRKAIQDGYIVCIFAEGAITRTGMLGEFKSGFEKIMKNTDYSIIPAYIGGAWGSIFSYVTGRLLSTWPKKFPYPISVHFGKPLPADSSSSRIRQKVMELSCDYFNSRRSPDRSLAYKFVKTARKNRKKKCICDSTGKKLNYGQTLLSALFVAEKIDRIADKQNMVGIMLPPSVPAAIANLAVTLSARIPVNLNYVASTEARKYAIEQCGIKCIITSRKFLEKAEINDDLSGMVYFEDIVEKTSKTILIKTFIKARFLPLALMKKLRKKRNDDLATVIFSSGSTGTPKGVMLSHHNIISNIEAARMVIRIHKDDDFCAVLPLFHSFGFTCALWMPMISGISTSFIANPLDAKLVGKVAEKSKSTVLFAPPTFFLSYIRRTEPSDFSHLRLVLAGAEKLNPRLADSFEARFKIRPLEGYGATELSPVTSLNVPDVKIRGLLQIGNKPGSAGHPLPGIAAKIIDLDTQQTAKTLQSGLLMIKGPNVMAGYLNMEEKTNQVLRDNWYDTGDIASIDEDGFITIKDRLARFSKIAGEMVPHLGIEQIYFQSLKTSEQVLAVTSVPDPKKGEELIVLYIDNAGPVETLHEIISNSDVPNMWKPRKENYIKIDSMPLLGSGKLDILKLRKIALASRSDSND